MHGIIRRSSSFNTGRIEHLYIDDLIEDIHKDRRVYLHYGDMQFSEHNTSIRKFAYENLILRHNRVKVSFEVPEYTADADAVSTSVFLKPFGAQLENKCQIASFNLGFSEKCRKFLKRNNAVLSHFHMRLQNNMARDCTARSCRCLLQTGYFSTMKANGTAKHLLQEITLAASRITWIPKLYLEI